MQYKIIFSDIDGTLLNSNRELSENTITTIKALKAKLPFVLISARMPAAMRYLQKDLELENQPMICYNGGLVLVNNQPISSTEIPVNIIENLIDFNSDMDCHLSLYYKDEWYVPRFDKWAAREENNTQVSPVIKENKEVLSKWKNENKGAHKIMAMGTEDQIDKISEFLNQRYPDELNVYRSKSTYLEIAHKSISKFTAIQFLLKEHFGLNTEEAIAYGDNYNDVEMIKNIGLGVAVANARKEVLDVAKIVTHSGIEDGVAKSLNKILKM